LGWANGLRGPGDALTSEITFTNDPESVRAAEIVKEVRGEEADAEFVVVRADSLTATDPAYVAYVDGLQSALAGSESEESVRSYLTQDGPVSESGATVLLPVTLAGHDVDELSANADRLREVVAAVESAIIGLKRSRRLAIEPARGGSRSAGVCPTACQR
jgi:hypothetical protein